MFGFFIARCIRDHNGQRMLQSILDHAQRPLVYKTKEQAKNALYGNNGFSLWVTYDGQKAYLETPGPYDDRGEQSLYDVPNEVTNEIAWLEFVPNSQPLSDGTWLTRSPNDQPEIIRPAPVGCGQELTVRCRTESFDVYAPNGYYRHFQSLAEADQFVESCKSLIEGIANPQIAQRLLGKEFRAIGCKPAKPQILLVHPSQATADHIQFEHIQIPVWTCEAQNIKRHWARRTNDPFLDSQNSCSVFEDRFGAITAFPVVEHGSNLQTPVQVKTGHPRVISEAVSTSPVPFPHVDRANSWLESMKLNTRIRIENNQAVCQPCPGDGSSVRKVMNELGFVRQPSLPNSKMRWSMPPVTEDGKPILFLEAENTSDDKKPKGGSYIDLTNGKDVTGKTFSSATMQIKGDNVVFRAGQETQDEPTDGTYIRANITKQGWQWGEHPFDKPLHDSPTTLITIRQGGRVFHAIAIKFKTPVTLKSFSAKIGEPRLKPVSRGKIETGNKIGTIKVNGSEQFPVYDCITVIA